MSRYVLKFLRLITPAAMFVFGAWLLGKITGLWTIALPTDAAAIGKSVWMLVIGALYYIARLRELSNGPYYEKVNENVRSGLVRAAGLSDDPTIFTWEELSGIFYPIVDGDPSLRWKADLAYFNGYFWTSAADCRAIAVIFFIFSLGATAAGLERGIIAAAGFGIIALLTYLASAALTSRHKKISDEQIKIMEHKYTSQLKQQLTALRIRKMA